MVLEQDDEEKQQCMAVNMAQDFQLTAREAVEIPGPGSSCSCSGSIRFTSVQCRGTEWVPVRHVVVCLIGKTYKHSSQMGKYCFNDLARTQCPNGKLWKTVLETQTYPSLRWVFYFLPKSSIDTLVLRRACKVWI